jgi:hypothetical protein
MTSLERAAAYLKKIGPKAALAIVPLAVAVPSHASLILSVTHSDFETGGAGSLTTVPGSGTLVNGTQSSGSYFVSFLSGMGITLFAHSSGGAAGLFPASLTGTYDFTITTAHEYLILWSLEYIIGGEVTNADGSFLGSTSPTNIAATIPLNGTPGNAVADWSAEISLEFNSGSQDGDITFDVAQLDVDPQDTPVPEPSTLLLMTPLAGLMIFRFRRRMRESSSSVSPT